MSRSEYIKARRKAQKTYRAQLLKGTWPYLQALDDIVSFAGIASEVDLGLVEVPLEQVAGTKTSGRQQSFASNFMPLLEETSEFAFKWMALYDAHISEGIRDPIVAVEFMNRFYVVEGNKRVSVLKYVDAVSVSAYVTRLIPPRNDSLENQIYYEFLDFYKVSEANYLSFSQTGCYARLLALLGKEPGVPWTSEEKINFHSAYIHFSDVYESKGGKKLPITTGDAFLTYLEIYGYQDLPKKSYRELKEEIPAIWEDFKIYPSRRSVEILTAPDAVPDEKPLMGRILPSSPSVLRIAFVHDRSPEESSWTYSHELGRNYLNDVLKDRVATSAYIVPEKEPDGALLTIQKAVDDGNTVIFTTSPKLLNASVKAALKYPSLRILNCSLNSFFGHLRTYYGRMYEAKYLTGILAGILSQETSIGYMADYPIYGSTASINAFALGVRAVNPDADIYLEWSCVRDDHMDEYFDARHISYVSGQDLLSPAHGSRQFGLYDIRNGQIRNVAMPIWHWGKFYERIVRSVLNGSWKKGAPAGSGKSINYFWGLSSGMIDVICSKHVPENTVKLMNLVKREIAAGQFHPFSGTILSQDGICRCQADQTLTPGEIGSIDWLLDNIHGSFPSLEDMTEEARRIVSLQGVGKYQKQ